MTRAKDIAQLAGAILLWLALFISISLMSVALGGCTSGGARKALVTTTNGVKAVSTKHAAEICDLVLQHCKDKKQNPCPALDKCHKGQKLIVTGAKYWTQGAVILNEVIPDDQ